MITAKRYDTKAMFDIANKLLFHDEPLPLPPYEDAKLLANDFNTFFISKTDKIMENLVPTVMHSIDPNYLESSYNMDKLLEVFTPIDIVYTKKLLQKTLPKSCELDPIPTSLIKMHSDAIADKITQIINTSLAEGTVSDNLKEGILCLLLKKSNLDVMTFKNYHLVSNLAYISKLLEWVACGQLTQYVEGTGNVEPMQLAYRQNYSTEMVPLCVKTDLLDATDKKEVTCLVLLDLSATFDMVKHSILLHHLTLSTLHATIVALSHLVQKLPSLELSCATKFRVRLV